MSGMTQNREAASDVRETHVLDYWRIIWRSRWMVAGIFVVVVTLVAIGTLTQKPVYRAVATVEISPQSQKVSPVADVANLGMPNYGWFAEERYFNTQYEIIRSRDVAQRVFDRLDLYNHPLFKMRNDAIGSLSRMLRVEPLKDTGIVEISLEGTNPEEIAVWVNATAEEYVNRNLHQGVQATASAVKALLREIAPLREKLQDTQQASFDYAERANLYVPENQARMTNDRLSTLQSQLTETQVKRAAVESVLQQVRHVNESGGSYETIPEISGDSVMQDLNRARVVTEREYEKLLVTFKDKHVRVLEKQSEIDKLNQKILAEANRIISNLRTEQALLRDKESKLAAALDATKSESMRVTQKASSYELVRGDATETKRIYDLISARIKEIELSSSLLSNNLRILDRAPVPKTPIKPRTILNLAVGVVLGLLLGVGAVFFLDYMDNTIRSSEDVEQFLKLNLLAIIPKQGDGTENAIKEAYQTLRTSLLFSRKQRTANVVLLTSAGPQEGKSCTTTNVARTFAQSGDRVVILDCDLRRPTIHQRLAIERDHGITNYILSETDDWRGYVKPTSQANLFAITCGPIPPNPADVFGHERFLALLKELRQNFDWVFIDSPPVISLADATILSSLADMVAFVIKHNENDRDLVQRCVQNIRKINANIVGAVLNSVDLERSHYKDYYYVGYYYYGEGSSRKERKRRGRSSKASEVVLKAADDSGVTRSAGGG
jgi:polysaccharide biosynthesis transport protein